MGKHRRKRIAEETLQILERGAYERDGSSISIADAQAAAVAGTRLFRPNDVESLVRETTAGPATTDLAVVNADTFSAARVLSKTSQREPVCLNFASARNPGGGFLNGAQAQEECLARASGLYPTLCSAMEYYEHHRNNRTPLYSNHMIYSPGVPVFRDDKDQLTGEWFKAAVITSAAVNKGHLLRSCPELEPAVEPTMRARIEGVLAVCADRGHDDIVLGAWGCGVFRNDPADMAEWFGDAIDGQFAGVFRKVVFAVLDPVAGTPTLNAFCNRLG